MLDNKRANYNPGAYRWPACSAYTRLPGINIADFIPWNLACQNNPTVRPAQLL